jgi:hypothetical protein
MIQPFVVTLRSVMILLVLMLLIGLFLVFFSWLTLFFPAMPEFTFNKAIGSAALKRDDLRSWRGYSRNFRHKSAPSGT